MVKLSVALVLLPLISNIEAFSSITGLSRSNLPSPSFTRHTRNSGSTKLNVGTELLDPEDVFSLGQECIITPEGYGFSSSMSRILRVAGREGGYYRATASEIVTDVMEGITDGVVDIALVFDDETNKLLGIFTETDYIKVRLSKPDCFE
jgi:hypothetical protein